jgi:hypothetical protein
MLNPVLSARSLSENEMSPASITLKWVNENTVDVFRGHGWENWSRFQKTGNHFKMIAGQPLTTPEYLELKNHEKSEKV